MKKLIAKITLFTPEDFIPHVHAIFEDENGFRYKRVWNPEMTQDLHALEEDRKKQGE